ncbi:MAG: hypothetical protein R3C01_02105 [Planctomycetaceae bacterium]
MGSTTSTRCLSRWLSLVWNTFRITLRNMLPFPLWRLIRVGDQKLMMYFTRP